MKQPGIKAEQPPEPGTLILPHGGYRNLKTFQLAELVYDLTVRFCNRYIETGSRTRDQMIQAARSGVQNIVEGSQSSGTSKKTELKLTNVARASLEELRRDYLDFLRQGGFPVWQPGDPRREDLIHRRPANADDVAAWAKAVKSADAPKMDIREIAANSGLLLVEVCAALLDRQIKSQAAAFENEGGFSERLYRHRQRAKGQNG